MNKLIVFFLFFSGAVSVFAEDKPASTTSSTADTGNSLTFIPSIAFLEKELHFEQQQSGNFIGDGEFTSRLPMVDVSLTTVFKRVFFTLKYNLSVTEVSTATNESGFNTGSSNRYFWQPPGTEMTVEREDESATLGVNVVAGLNMFVGFMDGKTTMNIPPTCKDPSVYTPPPPVTQVYCPTYNFAWYRLRTFNTTNPGQPLSDYKQVYEEKGPYIGLSYAWSLFDTGVFSMSAAYAEMDGTFKDNLTIGSFGGFNTKGDVSGTSLGLTWTAALTDTSSYFIDLRRQAYSMKAEGSGGEKFKTDETMTGLTTGMQFYF